MSDRTPFKAWWGTPLVGAAGRLPRQPDRLAAAVDGRLVAGDHPGALPDALAIGGNPWRPQVRPVDRRHRHRPALHPGGDGAGAESLRSDLLRCVDHQPVGRGRGLVDAAYRRGSRHGVLFQHARRLRGDGQPRRAQWRGAQPRRGGAKFAGVGGGAVRAGGVQVFVGRRCTDRCIRPPSTGGGWPFYSRQARWRPGSGSVFVNPIRGCSDRCW